MHKIELMINDILEIERRKIETVLFLCKSPIEKLFLLNFLQFYWKSSLGIYNINYLHLGYGHFNEANYPAEVSNILSTLGSYIYGVQINNETLKVKIDIIPQYEVKCANGNRYLDFGIILEHFNVKTNSIEKVKFFIECDGHEFHSSAEKIEKDNTRANELKAAGWNEFRYSGRTINRDGFDAASNLERYISEILKPQNQFF